MEQQSIMEELLSLRQEVQALKFLNGGGVLTDLITRVNNIERSRLGFPDFSAMTTLVNKTGTIVDGWNNDDICWESTPVPQDGWIFVRAHAENHDQTIQSGDFTPKVLIVTLNDVIVAYADCSSGTFKTHMEATDCNVVPVKSGDVIRYGYSSASDPKNTIQNSPNGYYNRLVINLFAFKK